MRALTLLAVLVIAALANFALWVLPNRPQPLAPLPDGKLASVSFSPFRDGESPLRLDRASRERVEEDLAALAPRVHGVRTYTSLEGLEVVPELAREHGLKVTLGGWLSSDAKRTAAEVASLIDLANRYPDVVTRVIVGNEVLLRGELPVETVIGYLRQVKAAVRQPVSYADVWEWWLKYPQLAGEVDFITIHLLPYWEDIPAAVDNAPEHIVWAYHEIARRFPGKPILVGEAGWPTAGRARGPAVPGRVEMARFINGFVALATREGFDYNLIEAFDQKWKQKMEGVVGGHWGLYDAERRAKFPLAGPVVENPRWRGEAVTAIGVGAALFVGLALAGGPLSLGAAAALAGLSQGFASAWARAFGLVRLWDFDDRASLGMAIVMLALTAVFAVAALIAFRRIAGGRPAVAGSRLAGVGNGALLALGVIAVAWSFAIVFDGRYRDFPVWYFAIPALGVIALGLGRARWRAGARGWRRAFAADSLFGTPLGAPFGVGAGAPWRRRLVKGLAWALAAGAVSSLLAEGVLPIDALITGLARGTSAAPLSAIDWTHPNLHALVWTLFQALLAVPFLAEAGRRVRAGRVGVGAAPPPAVVDSLVGPVVATAGVEVASRS